jgi:uncharacterized membrane-anchored protein YitT (DUF2179 family)
VSGGAGSRSVAATAAAPPEPVEADVTAPAVDRHTLFDDAQAIVTATAFASLGCALLAHARLVAGGMAGVALLVARVTPVRFGVVFLALNLPFFWLGIRQMGWRFTLKTFLAIGLFSGFSELLPLVLRLDAVHPVYAAVMGGFLVGTGLLMLFRHQACLGGLNILSIYLQERHGVRAGAFQMAVDSAIVVASLFVVPLGTIAISVLGAVALNLVLAVNHKPGRYLGT